MINMIVVTTIQFTRKFVKILMILKKKRILKIATINNS